MVIHNLQQSFAGIRRTIATAIARAATDRGFARFVGWFRFITLLFLTARFAWGSNEVISHVIPYALWSYFLSILFFRLLADFFPNQFDTQVSRFAQVTIDMGFITLFYYASGDLKSDIFQLYILPLLIVARYTNKLRSLVCFLGVVFFATFFIWLNFSSMSPDDFATPHVWFMRLVSRVGFLVLFTIFYTVYQRRQRIVGDLQSAKDELLNKHRQIQINVFSVDPLLRITGLDEQFQIKYGVNIIGKPYYQVFCPKGRQPKHCPVSATIRNKKPIDGIKIVFEELERGTYPVRLSTSPIFSKTNNLIGVTVMITKLQAQEAFEDLVQTYAENVKFAIDYATLEYESWAADKTRQLNAITEATAAALLPDQPLGIKQILQSMADLLRCQSSDLRLYKSENGQPSLVLYQAFGYDMTEGNEWQSLDTESTSFVAMAFRRQQPIQVYDIQQEPQNMKYITKAKLYGLHSAAAFPLMARGELIGTVSMYRQRCLELSIDELELGQAFANSLAATISSQKLVEQTLAQTIQQTSQIAALSEISRELPVCKDITTLADIITKFTKEHLKAEVAALFLVEEGWLCRKAIVGVENGWFQDERYELGQGLTGQVARYLKPVCINNADTDPEIIHEHLRRYQQKLPSKQVKHLLAVPLVGPDGLLGVLRVVNQLNDKKQISRIGFGQYDQDLLTIISHSVAVSIQSTRYVEEQDRLINQQRRRASNLLKLNSRTAEFTVTSSYCETLTLIALGLKDLLNCSMAGIGIHDRRTGEIRAMPDCGTVGIAPELVPQLRFTMNLSGGEVLRSRRLFKTTDAQTDPDSIFGQELPALVNAHAIIAIPLYVGGRDVGILYAAEDKPRTFSPEEEQLCEIYARQASVAIRNTELLNELNKRVAILENLGKAASYASEKDDLPEVLKIIVEVVNQAVGADLSFIAPFSTSEDRLDIDLSVTAGNDGNYAHPPRIRDNGLTKKALDSPDGYFIVEDYAMYPTDFTSVFVKTNNITSTIAVRLEFKKDIVGVLYVNFYAHHHFSEENIETLRLLAAHIAMAIHTFNLMQRNKDIAKERERERLREDMHSVLGSFHSRIMFAVERIRKQIESLRNPDHLASLDRLWDSSSAIYRQMERILSDMRDPILAERGLKIALEDIKHSYKGDLLVAVEIIGDCQLSPDVELALYRITQECLHNVVKHTMTKLNRNNNVLIQLDMGSPIPRLLIQDYGQGFDVWRTRQVNTGIGLKLIENWARRIQATLDIKSELNHGTIISVSILEKDAKITK